MAIDWSNLTKTELENTIGRMDDLIAMFEGNQTATPNLDYAKETAPALAEQTMAMQERALKRTGARLHPAQMRQMNRNNMLGGASLQAGMYNNANVADQAFQDQNVALTQGLLDNRFNTGIGLANAVQTLAGQRKTQGFNSMNAKRGRRNTIVDKTLKLFGF